MMKISFTRLTKRFILSVLTLAFAFSNAYGQSSYSIQFQDQNIEFPENINSFQWSQMPNSSKLNQNYYGWIQFYETPNQATQELFKSKKLELLEYIPNKAYLFKFPQNTSIELLQANGVRGIQAIAGEHKLSSPLKNGGYDDWALDGDNILVTLQYHQSISAEYVIRDLANQQISVVQQYKGSNNIDLSIPNNCLETLSNMPYVKWIELIVAPSVPDDTRGRSLHRSNGLDTQTTAGRNYTGLGIGVLCRDDGIVGPHIDFQGRIDNSTASGSGQTHGDGVSGIMAGAGNLNPKMRGMASGSNLHVVNYQANFLDTETVTLVTTGDVQITNSSYSNGCNGGYTSITQTVDTQTKDIPSLLHVFSAGNSNNNNCGYGAGSQWGNITGGHKQGKNVIATANVFFDGSLVNSSSRGPAHDGRIKPDIAANGQNQNSTNENNTYQSFGGTSGAAPGIAGISAQLYEVYGDANGGALPQSALIKATLLNTANEAGNVGPDYKFGWGIVNGLRAGMLLEDGRYLSDNITQGVTNNHTINVPAGTTQVRFMVYWSDAPAAPGASPALVNDLDLVVTDPSTGTHLPWILDPTPNATTLNLPAINGADHLNNMEQVLLNNPAAGNYDIEISGFNVPVGPQEYFIVYEIISESLTLTYPNAGESFVPGETESIHWDATNTTADFDLEYSTDNGVSWNAITTVNSNITNYGWAVPASVTGEALIRITSGGFSDTSDETFSIAGLATNVNVSQVCQANASFGWTAVAGAESYDFYMLGSTYMDLVGNSASPSITVPITNPSDPIWAAVVARNDTDGWVSRRTIAIYHPGGLVNCSLNNDLAIVSIDNSSSDFALVCAGTSDVVIEATFGNSGINPQSNFTVSYQLDSDPVVQETYTGTLNSGQQAAFSFTTPLTLVASGNYTLTVSVELAGDQNASNDTELLNFFATINATQLNFSEDFETNGFPPPAWTLENGDNATTWVERSGITGSDGNATVTSFIDNYIYNAPNELDVFVTEIFDLTTATTAELTFDLAKAQYSSSLFDSMRVEASIDCGMTYTIVYDKTGLNLSTVPNYVTSNWSPASASDWRNEQIDLSTFLGENIMFRFVNINGYGNSTYVDNISVIGGPPCDIIINSVNATSTSCPSSNDGTVTVVSGCTTCTGINYTLTPTAPPGAPISQVNNGTFVNLMSNSYDVSVEDTAVTTCNVTWISGPIVVSPGVDTTPPIITCPANVTVECGDDTSPAGTGSASSTDLCDATPAITFSDSSVANCGNTEIITRTWTATDASSNSVTCTQTITVVDTTDPVISCPVNITMNTDLGTCEALVAYAAPAASDGCGGVTVVQTGGLASGSAFPIGTTTNTFEVTDSCGNTSNCSFDVIVADNEDPVVACSTDQTVDPGVGNLYTVPDYFATGDASATDNCTDPLTLLSQDPAPGTLLSDGIYTVTMTAEDAYGNTGDCDFELTVDTILGVSENELANAISLYPNPATNEVNIAINGETIGSLKIVVVNSLGQILQSTERNTLSTITLDVSSYATGLYFININADGAKLIKKLLIK